MLVFITQLRRINCIAPRMNYSVLLFLPFRTSLFLPSRRVMRCEQWHKLFFNEKRWTWLSSSSCRCWRTRTKNRLKGQAVSKRFQRHFFFHFVTGDLEPNFLCPTASWWHLQVTEVAFSVSECPKQRFNWEDSRRPGNRLLLIFKTN